ncbi:MAG: type 3 dihydrofolate reductase [Deltaproteobacteria bacterium]|nr:MAG: type 3 dihydrofolate reductase [Deltaproteobacteria bacterium]
MLSLIWAQDESGLIGRGNRLPWRLPADLAWFRRQTMGKPVLMGRRTFESIGRPLPGRENLVLSTRLAALPGCTIVPSLGEARRIAGSRELMVIGGAQVYRLALPHARRLYLTEVHARFDGDVFFPDWDRSRWREVFREDHEADADNPWPYSFVILEPV